MNLEPFANCLQAMDVGVIGNNIFLYNMPNTVHEGILFVAPLSGMKIDPDLPNYRKGKFQVIVRSEAYSDAKELADSVMGVLDFANKVVDNYSVKYVRPRTEPVVFPVSEGDYIEFSLNFNTVYVIN